MTGSDERGSMTVLAIGIAMVVFAVAGLAVDGTHAFIERRSLQSAADAAVVSAAADLDTSVYYRTSTVRLDVDRAHSTVGRLLARRGIDAEPRLRVDDGSVELMLMDETRTTWLRLVGIESITISASSRAEPFPQDLDTRR